MLRHDRLAADFLKSLCGAAVLAWTGLCVAGFSTSVLHAADKPKVEQVANPVYQSWADRKPGTLVRLKTVSKTGGIDLVGEITLRLKTVAADQVVLEMVASSEIMGVKTSSPPMDLPIQATAPAGSSPLPGVAAVDKNGKVVKSEETVTINGVDIPCEKVDSEAKEGPLSIKSTTWTSPQIPGMVVKSRVVTEGQLASEVTTELQEVTDGK